MLDLQVLLDAVCIMSTACETQDFHCLFLVFHYLRQGDSNPKAECSYNLTKDHLGPVVSYMECIVGKYLDQPVHLCSLIRVFPLNKQSVRKKSEREKTKLGLSQNFLYRMMRLLSGKPLGLQGSFIQRCH